MTWLPQRDMEKWNEAKEDALSAMKSNDIDRLGTASGKMVALFPSNPMSLELLGLFHLLSGDHQLARDCFGQSRDVVLLSGTKSRPRCYKMIRDQLLDHAGRVGH